MLGAAELAKKRKRNNKIAFSPHEAAGASTSNSAWRVYTSLYKRGFLELQSKKKLEPNKKDKFLITKLPKNFKPFFFT